MYNSLKWPRCEKVGGQKTSNALHFPFSAKIWLYFQVLFQRAVVNIPIQTLIFSPWFLLRKRIVSQLELGLSVGRRANVWQIDSDAYLSHFFDIWKSNWNTSVNHVASSTNKHELHKYFRYSHFLFPICIFPLSKKKITFSSSCIQAPILYCKSPRISLRLLNERL